MTAPNCKLSHDVINKMFVILAHCDELDLRIPSPWCFDRTAKIRSLADEVSEMMRSPESEGCPARDKRHPLTGSNTF